METTLYQSEITAYDEEKIWDIIEEEAKRLRKNLEQGAILMGDQNLNPTIMISIKDWSQYNIKDK
jgi:hypothetical protein